MATQGERIARLEEKVSALTDMVKTLVEKMDSANDSRKELHHEQGSLRRGIDDLGRELRGLKSAVEQIRPTTDEYLRIREQVTGAGKLGAAAWRVGKWVIAATGWLAAVYAYVTSPPAP